MSATALDVVAQGLTLAIWLLVPVALAALLAGVVSSVLQGVLAWQDPALSQVPRVVAVVLAWLLTGPWVTAELVRFARLAWGG